MISLSPSSQVTKRCLLDLLDFYVGNTANHLI